MAALARACVANAKDDRQQFGVSQSLGTILEQFFSGPIFRWPFFDAGWVSTHGPSPSGFEGSAANSEPRARRPLYHNGGPSPILSRQALLDIRLPDDAGSPGGRWDGRVVLRTVTLRRRIDGGAENDLLEQIDREMLRTREGEKEAAGPHVPQSV